MNIPILDLVLLIASVWRLASLVANEEGPHMIFHRLRKAAERYERKARWFRHSRLAHGMTCEWCNSIWFGALLGWGYLLLSKAEVQLVVTLVFPLALSTGAILVKHIIQVLRSIDIRYDQENQRYLMEQKDMEERQRRVTGSFVAALRRPDLALSENHKERSIR